jgi:hypothetical protein
MIAKRKYWALFGNPRFYLVLTDLTPPRPRPPDRRRPEPAWNGYLLTVACPCGVVVGRWVTPEDAELDLVQAASLN